MLDITTIYPRINTILSNIYPQEHPCYPVIAISQYRNHLYVGTNSYKTSPRFRHEHPNGNITYRRHAEMDLILRMQSDNIGDFRKVKIYVMRFKKDGSLGMARPCDACRERFEDIGIKESNVFFTNWQGEWEILA